MACNPRPSIISPSATPTPPRVLVLTPEQYTYGADSRVEHLIIEAGGVNAAQNRPAVSQVDDRDIIAMQPDIIVFTEGWTNQAIEAWATVPIYAQIPAVRNQQLYQMPLILSDDRINENPTPYLQQFRQWLTLG